MKSDDEYQVGYAKPPKQNQFKRGVSGNPKGRPKRMAESSHEIISRVLYEKHDVEIDGKRRRVNKFELICRRLANAAAKGDKAALRAILTAIGDDVIAEGAKIADKKRHEAASIARLNALVEKIRLKHEAKENALRENSGGDATGAEVSGSPEQR